MEHSVILSFIGPVKAKENMFMDSNNITYGSSRSINGGAEIVNAVLISTSTVIISEAVEFIVELVKQGRMVKVEYKGFTISEFTLKNVEKRMKEIDDLLRKFERDKSSED